MQIFVLIQCFVSEIKHIENFDVPDERVLTGVESTRPDFNHFF